MRTTRQIALAILLLGTLFLGATAGRGPAGTDVRNGGSFRVSVPASELDSLDPALAYTDTSLALLGATCARLMSYPDKPPPEGLRLVPEVAAAYPASSRDHRTWTFRLRARFRFSDGTAVRASAFARAIYRMIAPGVVSPGAQYVRDIVGAASFHAGKTPTLAGVTARGNILRVRFTRAVPDFPVRTTMAFFCAVPPGLPPDPEGQNRFPSAGPYFVSEYRAGERAVLERNRFYGGMRPHHVDRFVVDARANSFDDVVDRVERGDADWGWAPPNFLANPQLGLAAKYGVNRSQFFVQPSERQTNSWAMNTSRSLFRDNPRLRQAVNFALDRRALHAVGGALGSRPTDQYLPPSMPGFKDARIYPLGAPDLRRARALARGHTRGGNAVLYTYAAPTAQALGQVVKRNLAQIGINVVVKGIARGAFGARIAPRGAPYDLAFSPWEADYADPYAVVTPLLDGQFIGNPNASRFNSPKYNRLLRQTALLSGEARYQAYGNLDIELARDAAPMAAFATPNEITLVSKRVGCVVLRPKLDLATVCLE
jgi:peptide/nickel transport system substrate-binding protein